MTNNILSENFKKFRVAKGLTQEQVATALHVNAQTVSRWECAATLPDVLTLPELAKLYGVTVDDFYKKSSVAYANYAQRLASVYELTLNPEDFLQCILEFEKMIKNNELSTSDKWNLAATYHIMLCDCKEKALKWYDKTIADGVDADSHAYCRARSMKNQLLFDFGKGGEVITEQLSICEQHPNNVNEWIFLIEAYIYDKNYAEAYSVFCKAIERFPDNWTLFIHGGEICQALKKYDEAFSYWDKAGELGTDFFDEYYCKAFCYEDMGEYEKSYETYLKLAKLLRDSHYDVEADMAEEDGQKVLQKMHNK
ncbi:MAG: helix-turn-helix domain-containing protein [Lachnospiraceae bacterium]|nr:helix-turn-helix domain-containing protein [Lachnospiraceae bacterium]MBQ7360591.1 helix-turn-helix domain-containing protein [Lachnospiraceae bacterium]